MEKFRIGNTLLAEWPITVVPFAELSSLNLRLEMTMPDGEKATMPFTIEDGNVINMYYQGKDQKQLGKYRLTLWHNESEDNQHVIDACDAFQLVPCTCKEGGEPSSVIAVRNVEILQGTLNIGAGYAPNAVLYTPQTLTEGQKQQARTNIGVQDVTGLLTDLTTQEKQNLVAAINEIVSAKLNKEINITDGKVIFSEQSDGLYIFTELNGQLETYIWIRTDGLYVNGRKVATINEVYTKAQIDTLLLSKQNTLTAGHGITIESDVISAKGGYTRIEKIHDYVHEIWYDGADYSFAPLLPHSPLGGCTSIRHGKFFARNLDWQYSECCEFFIHTPAANGRHAVDGFGGNIPALTKSVVESGEWNAAYNWLPLSIADGHNDAGLCASMNVVPTKTAPDTYERTTGTNPGKPTLNGLMVVRYILDNHTDALAAAEDIRDNWNVVMPHTDTFDEELHFLIADKTQTIVLEFVGNEAVIIQKPDQEGYITNFRLTGVEYSEYDDLVIDTIEPFGQGVERWEEIYNGISQYLTIENLLNDLEILYFTHAYNDDRQYNRRTDFAGLHDELTVQAIITTPSVYDATLAAAHQAYLDRTRDGQTWQTTHSVVYDIETGECLFRTQQDESTITRRDMALPIDAYTKAETDSLLEDKVDKVSGKGLSTNDYDNSEKSKLAGSLSDILGESTELPSGDTTMSIVYLKNDGEKGKVSLPLITPDNYGQNAYGIIRGEDFGNFNEKAEKTFIALYGVTPYEEVKAAYEAGTTIICQHSGIYEPLVSAAANSFTFCTLLNKMRFVSYLSANGWVEIEAEMLATAAALAAKQDTIPDLSDIRSGASAGATAVQPADLPAFGDIVTHDADEFATAEQGSRADTALQYIPQILTEAQKAQARENIADTTCRPFGRNMYPEEFVHRDGSHALDTDGAWKSDSSTFIFKITKKHDRVRETYNRAFICDGWDETGLINPVAFSGAKELTDAEVGKYIAVCHTSGYHGPMFSVYGENVWFEDDLTDKEIQAELDIIHSLYRPNEYRFNALTSATTTMYISPLEDCNGNKIRHVMGGCDDELGNQAWRYMVNIHNMQYANHCNLLLRHYVQRYNTSGVTSMYGAFNNCRYLESADLHYLDMSSVTSCEFMFYGCSSLTTLIGGSQDLTKVALNGLNSNLGLNATGIDRASLRAVINGLADRTGQTHLTLTLGNALKAKLTDEDILIATNKNWRIA